MGLSSSQARLLSLTGRMHDIEYRAQHLEAQKLQMANESAHVYQEYENALNLSKIQMKTIGTDGSANYVDATYNSLLAAGYSIDFVGNITSASLPTNISTSSVNKTAPVTKISETDALAQGYTVIKTADDLQNMQNNLSGKYILMSDIDLSGYNWASVGSISNAFKGSLDGNGYSIKNLTINNSTATYQGLFGYTDAATLQNINIENANITSGDWTSASAAMAVNGTTITICSSTVTVSGAIYTGGLVGSFVGIVLLSIWRPPRSTLLSLQTLFRSS